MGSIIGLSATSSPRSQNFHQKRRRRQNSLDMPRRRCFEVIGASLLLSIVFTSISVWLIVNYFQLNQPHLLKGKPRPPPFSHNIPPELSFKLFHVWKDELRNIPRQNDSFYKVNVTASDRISLDRKVPRTVHQDCLAVDYDEDTLPQICIVIPFYNEPLSLLLRTVHSILNRTPSKFLEKIILVDDMSDFPNLGEAFERYIAVLPKTVLIRNSKREGLIRTRLVGFEECTADVVMFQDGHTEANEGWVQPVLHHLQRHPNHLVQPGIDVIKADTIEYQSGLPEPNSLKTCTFTWDLRYVWTVAPPQVYSMRQSFTDPFPTPQVVGCTLAVNRKHFITIGAFDEAMDIWGGENLEVSMRYWQCQEGAVVTVPCSRVAHLFKPIPYSIGKSVVSTNLARVADVWLDEFRPLFYASASTIQGRSFNVTSKFLKEVQHRRQVARDNLRCRPFHWYRTNLSPEVPVPPKGVQWFGEISGGKSKRCIYVMPCGHLGITHYECPAFAFHPANQFYLDSFSRLRQVVRSDICIDIEEHSGLLTAVDCAFAVNHKFWFQPLPKSFHFGFLVGQHVGSNKKLCATSVRYSGKGHFHFHDAMVEMLRCEDNVNDDQVWNFFYNFGNQTEPNWIDDEKVEEQSK